MSNSLSTPFRFLRSGITRRTIAAMLVSNCFGVAFASGQELTKGGRAAESTFVLARLNRGITGFAAAAAALNACDLNQDATVNVVDVQLGVNMYLGMLSCSATVEGPGVCNRDVINRITTAALGGTCVTGAGPHSVTLNWAASATPNISGYNLYRGAASGGPYTKINPSLIVGTSYVDNNVDGGQTYYYVATAVDSSNKESKYSNQAAGTVPTP